MSEKPVLVFVHGAWHNDTCWDQVRQQLSTLSYDSATVNLVTSGGGPNSSLQDDIAAVHAVVAEYVEKGRDVVTIVHSFGGVAGAAGLKGLAKSLRVKEGKEGGVTVLIYIAAFVVPENQSLADSGVKGMQMKDLGDNQTLPIDPRTVFYNDMPIEEGRKWANKLKPQNVRAFAQKSNYTASEDIPCAYLVCESDNAIPASYQTKVAEKLGPNAIVERCTAGHSPFLSQPDLVVRFVDRVSMGSVRD